MRFSLAYLVASSLLSHCLLQLYTVSAYEKNVLYPFPTAFSDNNRILALILAFDLNHFDSIRLLLHEYMSLFLYIC